MTMIDELKAVLRSNGADLIGFADLRGISPEVRENLPFAVSIAVALNPQVVSEIRDGPTKQYYAEYKRANTLLEKLGKHAAQLLRERGHRTKWFAATIIDYDPVTHFGVSYDPTTLSTRLPHKTAATQAGLGWVGKCALLVTRKFGSAVRLSTVLTDAELPTGNPIEKSQCGSCTACVDACPGHAPSGKDWHAGLPRESFFDAFACRKEASKLALEKAGINETICGICVSVCPWTQKYIRSKRTTGVTEQ